MIEPEVVGFLKYVKRFPPVWSDETLREEIRKHNQDKQHCIVVLDDDPTGTQTVHDVWVVTDWKVETLRRALAEGDPALYILTNSRSMTLPEAEGINRKIASNLVEAAWEERRPLTVVSRSDSTLRGHYPGEVNALNEALVDEVLYPIAGICIIPFFLEGGRYTAEDVHWVLEGEMLTPVAQTAYARDSIFGYSHSHLPSWVEEKTVGRVPASTVISITIDHLREGGPDQVEEILLGVEEGGVVIINALDYRDLEVFVMGTLQAERAGKRFLYRTAASFVKVAAGIEDKALLTREELIDEENEGGGLVIFGSHVPKSNAQLQALKDVQGLEAMELPVREVLQEGEREGVIKALSSFTNLTLGEGKDAVIYTSRAVILGLDDESTLNVGQQVSDALIEVVQGLEVEPKYVIAKGGITSSDVATKGLNIRAARVLGQIYPGVPVWQMSQESRWPGRAYVVFPGNVGDEDTVAEIVRMLQ
jgi:uncharacterized protein YgbK (DUF1537 family)